MARTTACVAELILRFTWSKRINHYLHDLRPTLNRLVARRCAYQVSLRILEEKIFLQPRFL